MTKPLSEQVREVGPDIPWEDIEPLLEALKRLAGEDHSKPFISYYERHLEDGTVIPTFRDFAQEALDNFRAKYKEQK